MCILIDPIVYFFGSLPFIFRHFFLSARAARLTFTYFLKRLASKIFSIISTWSCIAFSSSFSSLERSNCFCGFSKQLALTKYIFNIIGYLVISIGSGLDHSID